MSDAGGRDGCPQPSSGGLSVSAIQNETQISRMFTDHFLLLIYVRLHSLHAWPSDGMTTEYTERAFGRRFVPPLQGWLIYGVESRGVTSGYIISPFQGDQGRGQ